MLSTRKESVLSSAAEPTADPTADTHRGWADAHRLGSGTCGVPATLRCS